MTLLTKTPPTDEQIMSYVFPRTHQEISPEINGFINGMKLMRDIWEESLGIKEEEV